MADLLGIKLSALTAPTRRAIAERTLRVDRATMYALRAVGRDVSRQAKAHAPVLTGTLRKSIRNARTLKREGIVYVLTVAPRGSVSRTGGGGATGVPLYRGQMEELYGYMAAGFDTAMSRAAETHAAAWARAMAR
jgi:hypothetical protein